MRLSVPAGREDHHPERIRELGSFGAAKGVRSGEKGIAPAPSMAAILVQVGCAALACCQVIAVDGCRGDFVWRDGG